ncbi:MAG: hypothetical protein MUC50_01345 [Myxococcota bacterium]|nr:hypothetical protein [Myxococcota bacterium]
MERILLTIVITGRVLDACLKALTRFFRFIYALIILAGGEQFSAPSYNLHRK